MFSSWRLLFAGTALAAANVCAQPAAFDGSGRMLSMFYSGEEIPIQTNIVVPTPGWSRQVTMPSADTVRLTRAEASTTWEGTLVLGPSQSLAYKLTALERDNRTAVQLDYTASGEFAAEGIYWRIDFPREVFAGGAASLREPDRETSLPPSKERVNLLDGTSAALALRDAAANVRWEVTTNRALWINLQDKEESGIFTAWLYLHRGNIPAGLTGRIEFDFTVAGEPDATPATVSVKPDERRYAFRGFGGNYCFNIESPVTQYTLDNLRVAWARTEMTLTEWEPSNDNDSPADTDFGALARRDAPGSNLRREFELARQIQSRGIPYVVSIWRLPEWLYTDPNQKGPSDQRRRINPALWEELLESIGSYLLYARDAHGVEPDLFSFNEANIGVYVLFSPEEHRDAVKRIGAHLASLGLKTRMLLADATGPRGTHTYALPTASDAEAMQYVGAIGFHSWGGATAAQYAAWGDLAERLRLPLLVTELGYDAAGWRGRAFDSYWYGMRELQMYQEILQHARPQGTMYWEYTSDYSLVRDGLNPTERFWFTKQFSDLTPPDAAGIAVSSTHKRILATAFTGGTTITIHIANLGAARETRIEGLPAGIASLGPTVTVEGDGFRRGDDVAVADGAAAVHLPARSMVTLVGVAQP